MEIVAGSGSIACHFDVRAADAIDIQDQVSHRKAVGASMSFAAHIAYCAHGLDEAAAAASCGDLKSMYILGRTVAAHMGRIDIGNPAAGLGLGQCPYFPMCRPCHQEFASAAAAVDG